MEKDKEVGYIAVSSFIFLRFFAPAVLSPHLFGMRSVCTGCMKKNFRARFEVCVTCPVSSPLETQQRRSGRCEDGKNFDPAGQELADSRQSGCCIFAGQGLWLDCDEIKKKNKRDLPSGLH